MPPLNSVLLKLVARADASITSFPGRQTHALFLKIISASSPAIARKLHGDSPLRPFTISSLMGDFNRTAERLVINRNQDYYIRLTFLEDEIYVCFLDASAKAQSTTYNIDTAIFEIAGLILRRTDSNLCGHQSYEKLISTARDQTKIALQFFSPATFRSGGKRNVVFPLPSLVFASYIAKWNQYSPFKLPTSLQKAIAEITVTNYELSTSSLSYATYTETGFMGECQYVLPESLSSEEVKSINTLANFAFYCGTGAKTTMGMGQTRRIK